MSSFLEWFIQNGFQSPHKVLDEYVKEHTTRLPGDHVSIEHEPPLLVQIKLLSFDWDRLREGKKNNCSGNYSSLFVDQKTLDEVKAVVQSHITGNRPIFGPVNAKAVEYGIARFREDDLKGHIVEPLAFLSLVTWLENSLHMDINTMIRSPLAYSSLRGSAFEELIILHLFRSFCRPVPLDAIFEFHGTTPSWRAGLAQIVGRVDGKYVPVRILSDDTWLNPKLAVVHYAENIKEVLDWLEVSGSPSAPAVLIPGNLSGPDIMAWVEINGRRVLLMGQMKSYLAGNVHSLDSETMVKAFQSLHPDHWFKSSVCFCLVIEFIIDILFQAECDRQSLINIISNYDVLRFVGAYPLPPDLNLRSEKVKEAISTLGTDVPLATIRVDEFRIKFTSEREHENVLAPMEYALECKRKRKRN